MSYSREFFALNLVFATRVSQLSGIPLDQALLHYTNLFVRFGLGHDLNPHHPLWLEYILGFEHTDDDLAWTYQFAIEHDANLHIDYDQPSFGCFSYSIWDGNRLRLHFHNHEQSGISPLSVNKLKTRLAELNAMFSFVQQNETGLINVVGGSWLYHLENYRRFFPPDFLSTARPGIDDYPFLTLWSQFLDRNGQVRQAPAMRFINSLKQQQTLPGVLSCFPLAVMYLEAPLDLFYAYYLN